MLESVDLFLHRNSTAVLPLLHLFLHSPDFPIDSFCYSISVYHLLILFEL